MVVVVKAELELMQCRSKPEEGDGDMGLFMAGDMPGVDMMGEGGGGSDMGVEGEDMECLLLLLRLCFLYLTCDKEVMFQ